MGHGRNYHGKRYHDTPKGTGRHTTTPAPAAQSAVAQQFVIIDFLRNYIGSRWRVNAETHQFEADFETPIAHAIADFMQPLGIHAKLTPARTAGESTLAIAPAHYQILKDSGKFTDAKQTLEKQYRKLHAMGRRTGYNL